MDLTLPGYNYLGPGNQLDNGEPTNLSDYVAQDHDYEYQRYIDAGLNPYLNFNEADQVAIDNFGNDVGGMIGRAVFKVKKILAESGVIGHISIPPMDEYSGYETEPQVGDKRAAANDVGGPSKVPRTDNGITIVQLPVGVPRGAANMPIIARGAVNVRRSARRTFARRGTFKRRNYRRRAYRRRYYRRRY